jgi:hypothetical protein
LRCRPSGNSRSLPCRWNERGARFNFKCFANQGHYPVEHSSQLIRTPKVAPGIPVAQTLTLVNSNAACAPVVSYVIYLWQADRDGLYSLYTRPNESWLRGVQTMFCRLIFSRFLMMISAQPN